MISPASAKNSAILANLISPFVYSPFVDLDEHLDGSPTLFLRDSFPMLNAEDNQTKPAFEKLLPSTVEFAKHQQVMNDYLKSWNPNTIEHIIPAILFVFMVNNLVLSRDPGFTFSRRENNLFSLPHISSLMSSDEYPFRFLRASESRKIAFRFVRPNNVLFPAFPYSLIKMSFDEFISGYLSLVWAFLPADYKAKIMDAFYVWKGYYTKVVENGQTN